eukprot:Skav223021  [mRNA]  locus=scaffold1422:161913:165697:+ [translate_table: standard]
MWKWKWRLPLEAQGSKEPKEKIEKDQTKDEKDEKKDEKDAEEKEEKDATASSSSSSADGFGESAEETVEVSPSRAPTRRRMSTDVNMELLRKKMVISSDTAFHVFVLTYAFLPSL